jgi:hypothetical protein
VRLELQHRWLAGEGRGLRPLTPSAPGDRSPG